MLQSRVFWIFLASLTAILFAAPPVRAETFESVQLSDTSSTLEIGSTDQGSSREDFIGLPFRDQAALLARDAIHFVDHLRPFAHSADFERYLLPIRVASGQAYAMAVHGDLSDRVHRALLDLRESIDAARTYTDRCLQKDETFDAAVGLLSVRERLDDVLR